MSFKIKPVLTYILKIVMYICVYNIPEVSVTQSCPTLCDPVDCSLQASLSLEFSRQEHWSGLPCPPPGDFPDPGLKSRSPALQADSLPSEPLGKSP